MEIKSGNRITFSLPGNPDPISETYHHPHGWAVHRYNSLGVGNQKPSPTGRSRSIRFPKSEREIIPSLGSVRAASLLRN
jgi:hypothetical protein